MTLSEVIHEKIFFNQGPVLDYEYDAEAAIKVMQKVQADYGCEFTLHLNQNGVWEAVITRNIEDEMSEQQVELLTSPAEGLYPGEAICLAALDLFSVDSGYTL